MPSTYYRDRDGYQWNDQGLHGQEVDLAGHHNFLNDYSSYGQSPKPGVADTAALAAPAASAFIPGAGLALTGVSVLSNLYGAYKAREQAEKDRKIMLQEMERQRELEAEQRQEAKKRQGAADQLAYATYAQNQGDRLDSKYKDYYRQIGL